MSNVLEHICLNICGLYAQVPEGLGGSIDLVIKVLPFNFVGGDCRPPQVV